MEDVQGKAAQQRSQLSALQQQRADVQTETDQLRRALTQQVGGAAESVCVHACVHACLCVCVCAC